MRSWKNGIRANRFDGILCFMLDVFFWHYSFTLMLVCFAFILALFLSSCLFALFLCLLGLLLCLTIYFNVCYYEARTIRKLWLLFFISKLSILYLDLSHSFMQFMDASPYFSFSTMNIAVSKIYTSLTSYNAQWFLLFISYFLGLFNQSINYYIYSLSFEIWWLP